MRCLACGCLPSFLCLALLALAAWWFWPRLAEAGQGWMARGAEFIRRELREILQKIVPEILEGVKGQLPPDMAEKLDGFKNQFTPEMMEQAGKALEEAQKTLGQNKP